MKSLWKQPATCQSAIGPPPKRDFAQVARRLADWTTKGIVSGLILVAGLGVGRQVLEWWRADRETSTTASQPAATSGRDTATLPYEIEFGETGWTASRKTFRGSSDEASRALAARCAEVSHSAAMPPGAPAAAEQRLVTRLAQSQPDLAGPGVYRLDGAFPIVAVVQPLTPDPSPARGEGRSEAKPDVVDHRERVVTWGIGVPASDKTWQLYTFRRTDGSSRPGQGFSGIPLPPGGRKTLSVKDVEGGVTMAFQGDATPGAWKRFFDDWFQQRGWTCAETWRSSGPAWHARYTGPAGVADVHFGPAPDGRTTGLLVTQPVNAKP